MLHAVLVYPCVNLENTSSDNGLNIKLRCLKLSVHNPSIIFSFIHGT